ncbi:MAG: hypothetical protein RLZZ436_3154 [Planctomycetota bacterium]|jgi:hypothetical protein
MTTVAVELELPEDWQALRLPEALQERLQNLLDLQDAQGSLSSQERREAEALVQLVDMLALMRLRADAAQKRSA